ARREFGSTRARRGGSGARALAACRAAGASESPARSARVRAARGSALHGTERRPPIRCGSLRGRASAPARSESSWESRDSAARLAENLCGSGPGGLEYLRASVKQQMTESPHLGGARHILQDADDETGRRQSDGPLEIARAEGSQPALGCVGFPERSDRR